MYDRFQLWVEQEAFERMWELGLEQYAAEVGLEREWMAMDGAMMKAPLGGEKQPEPILLIEASLAPNAVC